MSFLDTQIIVCQFKLLSVKKFKIRGRAFWCTRQNGKAGGAGGLAALLPEREVSSHPLPILLLRRRQNGPFGETKKPWDVRKKGLTSSKLRYTIAHVIH